MKIAIEKTVREVVEIEIKPCPFCGGEPSIKYAPGEYGYCNPTIRVECKRCHASIEREVSSKSEEEAYKSIAELWNRRANIDSE